MGSVVVDRGPRRAAPPIPTGEVLIEPPPEIPQASGQRWMQMAMMVPMLAGTLATAMLFAGRQGGAYSYVVGGVFGLSSLGMLATSFFSGAGTPTRAEMMGKRRDYLRHLGVLRRQVRATVTAQRQGMIYRHPAPTGLWSTVASHRLWERRAYDADFAVVRVGTGPQSLATTLVPPISRPVEELEPMTAAALRRFLDTYAVVPDLPVAVSLRSFARVYLRGAPDPVAELAHALVAQLAVFHAPDDVLIAACVADHRRATWDWLKWLPHNGHPTKLDRLGATRLVTSSIAELYSLLEDVLANRARFSASSGLTTPHLVVLLDGGDSSGSTDLGIDGVTLIDLATSPPRSLDRASIVLAVTEDGRLESQTLDDRAIVGRADRLSHNEIIALARQLAPLRLAVAAKTSDTPLATDLALGDLLDVPDLRTLDLPVLWSPRPNRDLLRVPIGVGPDGQPVELDIKEAAQDGMGPHGLLVGATGSGKSELLRTLVLGLAVTHSSETLNFVLVDFKGGATFASLDTLPHTSAVITNLASDLSLVDRMADALTGELERRQEQLHRSGNYGSLRDYERARVAGAALPPMPTLFVVVDEFAELLAAKPNFSDLFNQIGRVGRSMGVHLLLASQRLDHGRLHGLESMLSYRIALRTFQADESRLVLGITDAATLPRSPGHGFLKYATDAPVRFKAAYVSGPYLAPAARGPSGGRTRPAPIIAPFSTYAVPLPTLAVAETAAAAPANPAGPAVIDLLVDQLAGQGVPARPVWLPPLAEASCLDELLGALVTDPVRGLTTSNPALHGTLQVPVGQVDLPRLQRRDRHWLSLDGPAGNLAVVGGPQTGKSTLLRTMLLGLALTHTPAEVQFYGLDFGGGALTTLRGLPHVGSVATRQEINLVRRTLGELTTLVAQRERDFAAAGLDSMASYRARRSPEDPYGDVFLVIDGWSTIRNEFEDLEPVITDLATRGLGYGVHVVVAASRWQDLRQNVRDMLGSRIELALSTPAESMVNSRLAATVPKGRPGRGLTAEGHHLLTARPQLGAPAVGTDELVKGIASVWTGAAAPPVRLLPREVPYAALPTPDRLRLPIGIAESDMQPIWLDLTAEPNLLVYGDAECGKSTLLRALAASIVAGNAPDQARIAVIDYRRSLFGAITSDHLIGYCSTPDAATELVESIANYMTARQPSPEVTPEQIRNRSWWSGPECILLVDDYDMVTTGPGNPLSAILEFLPQSRDLGLHLIIVRRAAGALRSGDPITSRLRDLSTAALIMSGDPSEGPIIGNIRPVPLPPGRGRLLTRRSPAPSLIQLANLPE